VMGIYETDDNTVNDEDVYFLSLQAAAFYADDRVLRYPDAIEMFGRVLALEDIPEEATLLQKLQLHYKYGEQLEKEAEAAEDPATRTELEGQASEQSEIGAGLEAELKAELERQAREQFETGVNVGNALVSQYFESKYGYYYLALCYGKLGDQANFDLNMEQYRRIPE